MVAARAQDVVSDDLVTEHALRHAQVDDLEVDL